MTREQQIEFLRGAKNRAKERSRKFAQSKDMQKLLKSYNYLFDKG